MTSTEDPYDNDDEQAEADNELDQQDYEDGDEDY
jgi:hypothetical protein